MTAVKNSAPLAVASVMEIALERLVVAPWNARKTLDEGALGELAASIREHGIQVPLLVRPLREGSGEDYEIVAGHRRYKAATRIALATVPCIVRSLDDGPAREVGLIDNLQREDVPALEEADAYAELQERLGNVAAIASRVGKEVSYVARRLQLVSLAEMSRKALAERLITVDHALLLARLGEEEQNVNLKWCLDHNVGVKVPVGKVIEDRIAARSGKQSWRWTWEPQSPQRLKEHIEQNVGRKLSRAPWDLVDATLAGAVACTACPSNTKANDTLFGDLNIDAATCEDGACFERKREAFVQIRLSVAAVSPKADASKGPPVRLSWKQTTVQPRASKPGSEFDDDGFSLFQTFKDGQWAEAKPKSCEHVRLGVTVDWSDDAHHGFGLRSSSLRKPGQVLTVCIAGDCKAHPKAWRKTKSNGHGAGVAEDAEAAKRKRLESEYDKYEPAIREAIFGAIVAKLDPVQALLIVNDDDDDSPGYRKDLLERRPDLGGLQLEALVAFLNEFSGPCLNVNSYWMASSGVAKDREDLWRLAKKAGIDADKLAAAALPADTPDEIRAKLAPTPKKAAKPAAKKAVPKKAAKPGRRGGKGGR